MNDFLTRSPELLIPLSAIVLGCVTAMVMAAIKYWANVRRTEMEMALKQDMIRRGMSAEEIKQVLETSMMTKPCGEPHS